MRGTRMQIFDCLIPAKKQGPYVLHGSVLSTINNLQDSITFIIMINKQKPKRDKKNRGSFK